MPSSYRSSFTSFLVSSVLALIVVGVLFDDARTDTFVRSAFYFLFAACVFLLMALYRQWDDICAWFAASRREIAYALGLGLALTSMVFLVVKPDFRVLADETNLLSTSQGLFLTHELKNIIEILFFYEGFEVRHADPAHRPGLFAFLTSILHFIGGYRWYNSFALNFIVSMSSIAVFYLFFSHLAGRLFGLICAVLLAAFPIFQLNVASGGFDALNMLLVMLVYVQLYRFITQPGPQQLELLLLITLLAAQARYETAVLGVPVFIAMLLHWRGLWQWRYSPVFPLIPLLYLPVVWQKLVSSHFANPGDSDDPFKFSNLGDNFINMLKFFSDWHDKGLPTLRIIAVLAALGLVILVWRLIRQRQSRLLWLALALCVVGQVLIALTHFAYYTGNYQLAWLNRLAQVQLTWLIPLAALPLYVFFQRRYHPVLVGAVLTLILLHGTHAAMLNPVGKSLTLYRDYKQVRLHLQAHYPPRDTLVITHRSGMYAALGYSALSPEKARQSASALLMNLERGLFQNILFITPYNHVTRKHTLALADNYRREEVASFQYDAVSSVKIYRVLGGF
jgi:uncharacterized membrane protein YhfC